MNTTKVVIREVQGDSGFQMRQLLAERIGEPRKSAELHPHGQVLPLHKRSGDVFRVGIARSDLGYNLHDWAWGVPPFGAVVLSEVPEQFHKLREIHVQAETFRYSPRVMVQTVRGEL